MVDLFRFIEHEFVPPAHADSIDLANSSTFQQDLEAAAADPDLHRAAEVVRGLARSFLDQTFPTPFEEPAETGQQLASLPQAIANLEAVTMTAARDVVEAEFGKPMGELLESDHFRADKELLANAAVAVKLTTGFDRLDAVRLTRQVQAAAFIEHLADQGGSLDASKAQRLLARPLRVPPGPLATLAPIEDPQEMDLERSPDPGESELGTLRQERQELQETQDLLLVLRPEELRVATEQWPEEFREEPREREREDSRSGNEGAIVFSGLKPNDTAVARFTDGQLEAVRKLGIELSEQPLATSLDRIDQRLTSLNEQLLPHDVTTATKVFQLGGHLFAEAGPPTVSTGAVETVPDFTKSVTRPVGYGNLQVVRQELLGYEAGEISHIENVLPHEYLTRSNDRTEFTETTDSSETLSTRASERDQQSTDRSELATEAHREAGHQTTSSGPGLTSAEYGKLVENKKSRFAQTVVARSIDSVSQQVRSQRMIRESRSFIERVEHKLDNSGGPTAIRGVYQWLNKRYNLRVMNYGRRLLYDVVVPEPAAMLTQALKDSVQPETLQLLKPIAPDLDPRQVSSSNYQWYAARYGVTGSVNPPPAVFDRTVVVPLAIDGSVAVEAYGGQRQLPAAASTVIRVPEGYKAVRGFVQRVNAHYMGDPPGRMLEVFIGESQYHRLGGSGNPALNVSFAMAGETGDIAVSYRTFLSVLKLAFVVGVVSQRTDQAYAAWQLKTHAAIVSGYQRQFAEYEDKLARYVGAARARLAAAGGYSHNPAVVRDELKRALIFLLLGEHPSAHLPTPLSAPTPATPTLPNPSVVRDWGAMVAFFERAFEWENVMFTCYPYYWGRIQRWAELALTQDADPQFEEFLKAGAARVVVPVRPGFETALAHYQETGDVWMGEEIPDMFGENYVSILAEIKGANFAPGEEVCVEQWTVSLPTTLVTLSIENTLPNWTPTPCNPEP